MKKEKRYEMQNISRAKEQLMGEGNMVGSGFLEMINNVNGFTPQQLNEFYKHSNPIDYLNMSTKNLGMLKKPFFILADKYRDAGDIVRDNYLDMLGCATDQANDYISNAVITNDMRLVFLDTFSSIIEQLIYELDSLTEAQKDRLRSFAIRIVDSSFIQFKRYVSIDYIYKYAQELYGVKEVTDVLNGGTVEEFDEMFGPLITPIASLCAKTIYALFLASLFDALYEILLFEADGKDYLAITNSLKDILYDFEQNMTKQIALITCSLLNARVSDSIKFNDKM